MFLVRICIKSLEFFLHDCVQLFYLAVKQYSKTFFVVVLGICVLLLLVTFQEHLDRVDSKRRELVPGNFSIWVLISQSK